MESHNFLMWLFIIMWCGFFIMSCGCFIISCGYFIMWFVHYVMWFALYVLLTSLPVQSSSSQALSLLGTSQTGFKSGPSSCSFALSKITKWRE